MRSVERLRLLKFLNQIIYNAHKEWILKVLYHPNGNLISCSNDGTKYELGYEYGKAALFWSAFSANQETAWRLRLTYDSETASLDNEDKSRKYSVRCIQN